MYRVLIVCVGNVCRSPMAEVLMRHRLPEAGLDIASAGLSARTGDGVHPHAMQVLAAHGLAAEPHASRHVARQVDAGMLAGADLVLAMERRHLQAILALSPQVRNRLHLLGRWNGPCEVRDPCGRALAEFERTFTIIDAATRAWCMRIKHTVDS